MQGREVWEGCKEMVTLKLDVLIKAILNFLELQSSLLKNM